MSEIKTDKLTGVGTAGSISVTGEGNSTTTNLQQGLAKAFCSWGHTNHTSGIETFNIASITDSGTGDNSPNLTSNMAVAEAPATSGGCTYYGTDLFVAGLGPVGSEHTTSSFRHIAARQGTAAQDNDYMVVVVHGDLA
jgi:hypothetical protein